MMLAIEHKIGAWLLGVEVGSWNQAALEIDIMHMYCMLVLLNLELCMGRI